MEWLNRFRTSRTRNRIIRILLLSFILTTAVIFSRVAVQAARHRQIPDRGSQNAVQTPLLNPQSAVMTWQLETVDSAGDAGSYAALAIGHNEQLHISYFEANNDVLKYATLSEGSWQTETVDEAGYGDAGAFTDLALDSIGHPHISYHNAFSGTLQYAYHDGVIWHKETVDSAGFGLTGQHTSLAMNSGNRPHITYYDASAQTVRYAYYDGSVWHKATVDNANGQSTALVLDGNDHPHIAYSRRSLSTSYRQCGYAYHDGLIWHYETVDDGGGTASVGDYVSLALDSTEMPQVSYYDFTNRNLKYARRGGAGWQPETVDSTGDVGSHTSLALDAADHPHVSYHDYTDHKLKIAHHDGVEWFTETVDDNGETGRFTALGLDSAGQPHIAYYNETDGALRHASDVPLAFQRRALAHLEEVRGTEMAPGWEQAQLGPSIKPLYRPDINGIAYYEFPVVVPDTRAAGTMLFQDAGFIIVATGPHDYPVPHWDFQGQTPTGYLDAAAAEGGETATKFYKLDALAYTAEDDLGLMVAIRSDLPPKVTGLDPSWLNAPPSMFEMTWAPDSHGEDDATTGGITGTLVVSGTSAIPPTLQLTGWESWSSLKSNYATNYQVLLDGLQDRAQEEWDLENMIREDGGYLRKGETRELPLLWTDPTVSLAGGGASYVSTELITRTDLPPILNVTAIDAVPGQELLFSLTVNYPNGMEEVFLFTVYEPHFAWLPVTSRDAFALPGPLTGGTGGQRSVSGWTNWSVHWAGTRLDQRWYNQIEAGDPPNTSDCWSGCGGTAWAMLFGWADYQAAHGNNYWEGRWGLYRVDGGTGADAIAPDTMTDGVENMIWEIRNHIDTWCGFGNGATWPSDMDEASTYLAGRSFTQLITRGNNGSIPWPSYRERAWDSIKYRDTPAVIGIGFYEHYPLAYGYRQRKYKDKLGTTWWTQRQFYVNQGWGNQSGWVSADIWFVGEIRPNSSYRTNRTDDVALYRTTNYHWYYDYGHDGDIDEERGPWGQDPNYLPLSGDFDRDGLIDDVAVYHGPNHTWAYDYDHNGSTQANSGPWGWNGDLPMGGDFDRDGFVDDVAVYRPSTHQWYYDYDHDGDTDEVKGPWGWAEDLPFAGDFDRDGFFDDVAVLRHSDRKVYYDYNHNGTTDEVVNHWGGDTAIPVSGDFDLDGEIDDLGMYLPYLHWWLIDYDHNGIPNELHEWGEENDLPLAGSFGGESDTNP